MSVKKRIVMCGCHVSGEALVRGLAESGIEFAAFVCLTPEQGVKEKVSGYFDFRPMAESLGVPCYVPKTYTFKDPEDLAFFEEGNFDLLIQGGWQRLFPEKVLNALSIGAVGVHGSADFLPKGRGRSPLNWSLIEGKRRFILQLFIMTAGADDGEVFAWQDYDILPFDDISTLYYKSSIATREMLQSSLPKLLEGKLELHRQLGEPSYYPKRTPADGLIDWEEMDVWEIHNHVRAQTRPYPGAFAVLKGATHTIWKAQVFDTRLNYYRDRAYGEVVEAFGDHLIVNCRGGLLLITDWEPRPAVGN